MTRAVSTPVDGNTRIQWVPSVAGSVPTTAELTAAGSKDLSCWFTGDGWNPSFSENTIVDERICDTATYEQRGRNQKSMQVKYIVNPKAADQSTNNVAAVTLAEGNAGFFVVRRGVAEATAFAIGDLVEVWPVTMGVQQNQPPAPDTVYTAVQKAFVTAGVTPSGAIAS